MQNVYTRKTTTSGAIQYRNVTENKIVSKDTLDPALLARIDAAPEGTHVGESAEIVESAGEAYEVEEGVKTRTIELAHPLLVNGKVFKGGEPIEVPEDQADDLLRMDREHSAYEANLIRGNDRSRKAASIRPQDIQ